MGSGAGLASGERGFTLVEMMVAMAILGIVLSIVGMSLVTLLSSSISTQRNLDSQGQAEVIASALERYFFVASDICGPSAFLQAVQQPTEDEPTIFTASLGPDLQSPPQELWLWLSPSRVFDHEQEYTIRIAAHALLPGAKECASSSLIPAGSVPPVSEWGQLRMRLLLDVHDVIANFSSSAGVIPPLLDFCSAPGFEYDVNPKTYAAAGTNLGWPSTNGPALSWSETPGPTWALPSAELVSIGFLVIHVTARIGKSPAAVVRAGVHMANYSLTEPSGPVETNVACSS